MERQTLSDRMECSPVNRTLTPGSWRRFLATFFLVNLFLASYFLDTWSTPNPVSRALPVLTLFEEGTIKINTYKDRAGDKSKIGEDYYSDKPPLPTFLMVPFYGLLHLSRLYEVDEERTGKRFPIHIWKKVRGPDFDGRATAFTKLYPLLALGSFLCGSLPFALMLLLALQVVGRIETVVPPVVMVMMAFYGSYLFVFSGTFFGHVLAGALLVCSHVLLKRRKYLQAGILVGLAFLTDYPVGLAIPIWLVLIYFHERNAKQTIEFAAGAAPSVLLIMVYNYLNGGNPFRMLNAYHAADVFGRSMSQGYGFQASNVGWESLWGLSFSFYMGLFIFVPVLLVVLVELFRLYLGNPRGRELGLKGYMPVLALAYFLLIASFFTWWGGWSYGPRYLIPPACLLVYEGVVFLSHCRFSKVFFLAVTLFGLFGAWTAKATLLYMIPDRTTLARAAPAAGSNPVVDLLLPELLAGRFNNSTAPSIVLGLPPKLSVFIWPILFVVAMLLLTKFHNAVTGAERHGSGAAATEARGPRMTSPKKRKREKKRNTRG